MNIYGVIYKITDKFGHCYIGQHIGDGSDVGVTYFGSGRYIKNAIKNYGKDYFTYEIVAICYSKVELNEKEKYNIKFFNSIRPQGYNIDSGGNTGNGYLSLSEEEKLARNIKISKTKINKSDEEKAKIREKQSEIQSIVKNTIEQKKIHSDSQKATWNSKSEEEKARINKKRSASLEGNTNALGSKRTEGDKKRNSDAQLIIQNRLDVKNKIAETKANKSEEEKLETKKKQAVAQILRFTDPAQKDKLSKSHLGKNYAQHIQWHFNRGILNLDCQHCIDQVLKEHS